MSNIKLGLTLYSFTPEYAKGILDLEGIIRCAKEMGYTGYEMVATQMCPDYPYVSDRFLGELSAINHTYGMEIISYAANMDRGMRADRNLTEDEMLQRAIIDVKSANKLGCHVMREQFLCGPEVLRRLAPYAEEYDVRVGIEIHNPEFPTSPYMNEYRKVIEETGSRYIGFIPDFGCFAVKPNYPNWQAALRNGAREEMLQFAAKMRYDEVDMSTAMEAMIKKGANGAEMGAFNGMYGFVTFYNEPDLKGLKEIMPYCVEMHGKFHYIHEDLQEHSIPYKDILKVIYESDFDGYIMTEYEDHDPVTGDTFVQMKRHIDMEKKILKELNMDWTQA